MATTNRVFGVLLLCSSALFACSDERSGKSPGTVIQPTSDVGSNSANETPTSMGAAGTGPGSTMPGMDASSEACALARSPELIPNRKESYTFEGGASVRTIFTRDLFSQFKTHCGACHVDTDLGDFKVHDASSFDYDSQQWLHPDKHKADLRERILETMTSEDPDEVMPPPDVGGVPFSMRKEGDPVRELHGLIELWINAGSPRDLFEIPTQSIAKPGYRLSEEVAATMTNLGNCIPNQGIVGNDSSAMDKLDAFFADMKTLPPVLSQTDLVTFDAQELARQRVLAFVPSYPLFSDSAHKLRHVRVPRGQTLAFDRDTQQFSVPPNTRFYKTFFKKTLDREGMERYKKIETRIIVSRPDGPDSPNGEHETHSLFGAYMWNDSETEAFLVTDPLRNGKPFRDRLITYVTDENKAEEILAMEPADKVVALQEGGAVRSYAIPGSERCIQCHMGSINRSFALGLTPLQLSARAKGEGGTIEVAGPDEMNQLKRFVDYGVISGLRDMKEVKLLEDSEGDRKPRNKYELAAQGYMLGNCSYCHNPRGFPTTVNPELKNLLNFAPSPQGGIFQFPLDRVSPRIRRGLAQDIDIPYISPSLIDYQGETSGNYTDKWFPTADAKGLIYLAAPWRSLIYRNIDTPFPYSEDFALFPHMPMNASGYDCRAPRIFGDWMVSIPSKRDVPPGAPKGADGQPILPIERYVTPQPYVEVKPTDPDYAQAQAAADKRMATYHGQFTKQDRDEVLGTLNPDNKNAPWNVYLAGFRSTLYCPDTSDIVNPEVVGKVLVPQDGHLKKGASSLPSLARSFESGAENAKSYVEAAVQFSRTADGVPDMTHWVVTDISDSPGDWYPRRTDWDMVLVTHTQKPENDLEQQRVIDLLRDRKLTDEFKKFALAKHPYTLWTKKGECDLSAQPTVESYKNDQRLRWLDRAYNDHPAPAPSDRVNEQSWGEAVYNEICVNCHGPRYDSRGRQADTLMIMTGGDTRVANFRAGMFGPEGSAHANIDRIFGELATADVTADDWAARYMAWMGLGGTQRTIPPVIMNVVATLSVFGEKRPVNLDVRSNGANMLSIAATLCEQSLGLRPTQSSTFNVGDGTLATREPAEGDHGVGLIDINADYEMWLSLCSFDNPPPVRVAQPRLNAWADWKQKDIEVTYSLWGGEEDAPASWYRPQSYPAESRVGDERGELRNGVQKTNLLPWCVKPASDPNDRVIENEWVSQFRAGKPLPYCPTDWLNADSNRLTREELKTWAARGAINAGFAVFLYLDQLSRNGGAPQPAFDRCELLGKK